MDKCEEHSGVCEKINSTEKMLENLDKRFSTFQYWLMGIMASVTVSLILVIVGLIVK